MFKKNLAMAIYGLFIPQRVAPAFQDAANENERIYPMRKTKGQLRAAKGKQSGAASFKRAAKKRANIRKHS